ncbi:Hypothetical protein, putative [Bodo saltans]|uniref:Uncharacterized protein n=1 Tax=Bodo saltans TaxID=75058 RepID=A0A0S4JSI2_BODSA|nr:Hypothetical protein, putative [Bodo saltans]|eukprot:CUG93320.1 Hypothetical protein, putative [Bodo saltans]
MHALLQKHQLRPATQPSSARLGKPAGTALPPPGPTAPRLPSRQRLVASNELLVSLDSLANLNGKHTPRGDQQQAEEATITTGRAAAAPAGTRVVHSSSGRKFCLSSVEDLLTPQTPLNGLATAAGHQQYNAYSLPPRPATQGNDGDRRLGGGGGNFHHQHTGIPRLSSAAAAGEFPLSSTDSHHHPLHHVLAQEIAKMVRSLPTPTNATTTVNEHQHHRPPTTDSRNSFRNYGRSSSSDYDGQQQQQQYHVNNGIMRSLSPNAQQQQHHHQLTSWAEFASQSTDDEIMALLKVVLVRLLSGGGSSGAHHPASSHHSLSSSANGSSRIGGRAAGRVGQQQPSSSSPSASSVFQKMCVAFAEATGEAPPPMYSPNPTGTNDSPRGRGQQHFFESARSSASAAAAPSHTRDPDDDVAWQSSPRLGKQQQQQRHQQHQDNEFGPRHTSVRMMTSPSSHAQAQHNPLTVDVMSSAVQRNNMMMSDVGNEHALVSDAVLFRQIGILRRERDDMRLEVEALRTELQRQLEK